MAKKNHKEKPKILRKIKSYFKQYLQRFNFLGILFATIFFCISLLPSLLPRPWLYQGLISGISVAIGYGLGTGLSAIIRWFWQSELNSKFKNVCWKLLIILAPVLSLVYIYFGKRWQDQVQALVGEPQTASLHMVRILTITLIISLLLIAIARLIRKINKRIFKLVDKWLPKRVSMAISLVVILAIGYFLISGLAYNAFVDASNSIYSNKNDTTLTGISQPTSPYRSGSPESYIKWDTLGYQGRTFVASGPNSTQMSNFSGTPSKEQIRVYAGLQSAPDAKSRAQLALKELERTDAFSRKVLIVATATGTGWLEPQSVDSIEYMYGGDTAIVSQQYSYLPSWISFLVDKQNATEAGRELFDAVFGKWASLPIDKRPKLITYGLSLGSFGGQAAFGGVNDLRYTTDGALFLGTPSDTALWMNITNNRDKNSPEWQPIYQNGSTVRFAATNDDITKNQQGWTYPRILYMQHASDPVVWFNFNLILKEPDWLKEPRSPDVSPNMRWYPFVTFFQVTVDQFFGVSVPNGHGHNYPNTIVNAWASIIAPNNWNAQKTIDLQNIINTYANT